VAEKLISAGTKVEATTGDGALVHGAMGPWGHGAIGMTTSVRSSAMLFAGEKHVIVVKLSSIIFSNDHNSQYN